MATQQAQKREWDGILRRSFDIDVRGINEEARTVDVIASSTAIDAHGDILEQDWNLNRYRLNPVVLWHHNRFESSPWSMGEGIRPEDLLPIGHADDVRVVDNKLHARLVFGSDEYNEMSKKVFLGFKERHIRAVSVGFRPGKITEESVAGGTIFRLSNNELMEISAVPIPSNPEAVAKSIASYREQLGRMSGRNETERASTMTPEEQKRYEDALKAAGESRAEADNARKALEVEKSVTAQLERDRDLAVAEAKKANDRATAAEQSLVEAEIDKLVGKKITPAEREDQIALAKEVGLVRVKGMLEKRADIAIMSPASVSGQEIRSTQPAPSPVDGAGNGSDEIVKDALAAANA